MMTRTEKLRATRYFKREVESLRKDIKFWEDEVNWWFSRRHNAAIPEKAMRSLRKAIRTLRSRREELYKVYDNYYAK